MKRSRSNKSKNVNNNFFTSSHENRRTISYEPNSKIFLIYAHGGTTNAMYEIPSNIKLGYLSICGQDCAIGEGNILKIVKCFTGNKNYTKKRKKHNLGQLQLFNSAQKGKYNDIMLSPDENPVNNLTVSNTKVSELQTCNRVVSAKSSNNETFFNAKNFINNNENYFNAESHEDVSEMPMGLYEYDKKQKKFKLIHVLKIEMPLSGYICWVSEQIKKNATIIIAACRSGESNNPMDELCYYGRSGLIHKIKHNLPISENNIYLDKMYMT